MVGRVFLAGVIEGFPSPLSLSFQGGDVPDEDLPPPSESPVLLQWVKTDHALVMFFNNGTVQVFLLFVLMS